MSEKIKLDFTIIGGGIIGLCVARDLAKQYPAAHIALLEKNSFLGDETTGRNSGVLHAGIYYPHQSLKHQLCLEGHKLWKESLFIINPCGKFIFASTRDEIDSLNDLMARGVKNQVPGLKQASREQLGELQKDVQAIAALYSPGTSILDVPHAIKLIETECANLGVMVLKKHEVKELEKNALGGFDFRLGNDHIHTKVLFNCAGLHAVKLRQELKLNDIEAYWVKGHYLTTHQKLSSKSLIYPLPQKNNLGLGIHSTYDISGKLKFGPDTQETLKLDYSFADDSWHRMRQAVAKMFKSIDPTQLVPDYVGIRPKIKHKGEIYSDFWIKKPLPDYIEFLGIESPGLTAAPAIAKYSLSLL